MILISPSNAHHVQYIPRNIHTVFALLCFVVVIHWLIFPYPSGLLHWHCGNLTIAPVPAKQPWWIWINTSWEFIMNDCITTTKQSTTKPWAYFLGYTVYMHTGPEYISANTQYDKYLWKKFSGSYCAMNCHWSTQRWYSLIIIPVGAYIIIRPHLWQRGIWFVQHIGWTKQCTRPQGWVCCVTNANATVHPGSPNTEAKLT